MNFADLILSLLKRIAEIDVAYVAPEFTEGVFGIKVFIMYEGDAVQIADMNENSTETDITQFELELDLLENAVRAKNSEEENYMQRVRDILNKLTHEERMLIDRPLPEDLPPEDPDFCEYL
jgi:ribosomal protein S3